jgi:hypothetical protein
VKDVFEIKAAHGTSHDPGLVAVLDRLVTQDPTVLVGKVALIEPPGRGRLRVRIDGARGHGAANSLFFKSMTIADVPVGSAVQIEEQADKTCPDDRRPAEDADRDRELDAARRGGSSPAPF